MIGAPIAFGMGQGYNRGLSLRSRKKMLDIIKKHNWEEAWKAVQQHKNQQAENERLVNEKTAKEQEEKAEKEKEQGKENRRSNSKPERRYSQAKGKNRVRRHILTYFQITQPHRGMTMRTNGSSNI
jgi:hypothetical protein